MRAFLMSAVLTIAALTIGATSAQAHEFYHGHYHHRPPVVVIRPAPVLVAPVPLNVAPYPTPQIFAQPMVVGPAYQQPVVVDPVIRPLISLRLGVGR